MTSTPKIVDYEIVNDLIDSDDVNYYIEMLQMCLEQLQEVKGELNEAAQQGDLHTFNQRSHFIKGSCAAVGLRHLANLFEDMQMYKVPVHGEDPKERMKQYMEEVEERENVTREYIKKNTSWTI